MTLLTCPSFCELECEIIEDFMECLQENAESIEDCLSQLDDGHDDELINRLFRDVHSFKGNCRMVFLDPVVDIIHTLEEIVQDMRQGERVYYPFYREFFTEIVYRVKSLIRKLYDEGEVPKATKDTMLNVIRDVHSVASDQVKECVSDAVVRLSGGTAKPKTEEQQVVDTPVLQPVEDENSDLAFFKSLALQLDGLTPFHKGRTKEMVELCLETNRDLGGIVCEDQLIAAVYLHDLGMALVPRSVLDKPGKLTSEEFAVIQSHIETGLQILARIPGWEQAAEMVRHHHEKYDGSGYPSGLKGDDISAGAKIIALADTYYAITHERADRSYKKSLFSAVSLINGESGKQFDPHFVEAFNETVRRLYVGQRSSKSVA